MPYTEADFTGEFSRRLIAEHGDMRTAARAVYKDCVGGRHGQRAVAWRTVENWLRSALRGENHGMGVDLSRPEDPTRENRLDDLLRRANVPIDAIGAIESTTLKAYGGFMKGPDGEPVKVPLYGTSIKIRPPNPDFPVVQPAPSTTIVFAEPPRILRRTRVEVVVSDIQAGWLRNTQTDVLEPIHDPAAIEVAQQITTHIAPDGITFVGDVADLAMFSRWEQHPEYHGTLQPSVNVVHEILGRFIASGGPRCVKRRIIGSNHDHRIEKGVLAWNKEALGVRQAGAVDGWPVFSLGYLARFDDLGLEWTGHYPGGEFYLLDDLVIMHAPPKAKEFRASVIHGHTHHITRTTTVQHASTGRCTAFVYDIGCLCQVGATSEKFRLLVTKTPSDRGRTDWAQGIAVVSIVDASGSAPAVHAVDQVSIIDGVAIYQGNVFRAREDPA